MFTKDKHMLWIVFHKSNLYTTPSTSGLYDSNPISPKKSSLQFFRFFLIKIHNKYQPVFRLLYIHCYQNIQSEPLHNILPNDSIRLLSIFHIKRYASNTKHYTWDILFDKYNSKLNTFFTSINSNQTLQ